MDLRTMRTIKSIKEAFLQIRRKKPLEKITVKEIAELAIINKSTFYRYYEDIYALSNEIENDIISECVSAYPGVDLTASSEGLEKWVETFMQHSENFSIIFSGSREDVAVNKLHAALMEQIFKSRPQLKEDIQKQVLITSVIYGGFKAYLLYQSQDKSTVLKGISKLSELLREYVV